MATSRTFTIQNSCINVSGGRYKSSSPLKAAKKAATRLYKKAKNMPKYKNIRRITFTLRESTKGSDKKSYNYKAAQVKLSKPVVRVINDKEIVNKFKIQITVMDGKPAKSSKSIKCNKLPKDDVMLGGNEDEE